MQQEINGKQVTVINSSGITPPLGEEPTDTDSALFLFHKRNDRFLSLEDAVKDSIAHFIKITKGYKFESKNYINQCLKAPFRKHYKLRQTFCYSKFTKVRRREWGILHTMLHYVRTPLGYIYFLPVENRPTLVAIKSHVFERFIERALKLDRWKSVELPRDEVMFEVVRRLRRALMAYPYKGLPLIDAASPDKSAYLPVEDGYLVGDFGAYKEDDGNVMVVTLFKTFLSHNEVSNKKMDLLIELYNERIKYLESTNHEENA